jgi:hypothetical protein
MLKRLLIFPAVYAALSIYWRGIYDYGFYGTDELKVFISYEKATDLWELLRFILTPFTQHFLPVFKSLFLIEYCLFGASPAPYHAVSIGLYSISAILLWRFIYAETEDKTTACICTTVYAANTTYYVIVSWLFLQQFTLAMVFMLLALLSASRGIREGRGMIPAALYCMLSSFSISFGAAAWLFTSIFFLIKHLSTPPERRPQPRALLIGLTPLVVSAGISYVSYRLALRELADTNMGFLVFKPLLTAKGTALMYGDIMLETVGFYRLMDVIARYAEADVQALMPVIRTTIFASFFAYLALALVLSRKLSRELRAVVFSGLIFMLLSTAITIAGRAIYIEYDIYALTNTPRYKYFPFFSMLVASAPYIAIAGRRIRTSLLLLLPLWVIMHSFMFADMHPINSPRIDTINRALALVESTVDRPIEKAPGGGYKVSAALSTGSRYLEDIVFFRGQPMHYPDLMHLFKGPGEIITGQNGKALYLRDFLDLDIKVIKAEPENVLSRAWGRLGVSSAAGATLSFEDAGPPSPSGFEHLHMRMKADRTSGGRLLYTSGEGKTEALEFEVTEGPAYKRYLLPCPSGNGLRVELGPGNYRIKDIRLYY